MQNLGILKENSVEIVDIMVRDGSVIPVHCPGGLRSTCTACSHARQMRPPAAAPDLAPKNRSILQKPSLIICHWYEHQMPG